MVDILPPIRTADPIVGNRGSYNQSSGLCHQLQLTETHGHANGQAFCRLLESTSEIGVDYENLANCASFFLKHFYDLCVVWTSEGPA